MLVLLLALPVFSFAQNKITLTDGTSFVAEVDAFLGHVLIFVDDVSVINDDRIDIEKVSAIAGEMPKSRMRSILRKNPAVKLESETIEQAEVQSSVLIKQNITAGDYIYAAGSRYLTGVGVTFAGAGISVIGVATNEDAVSYIGGATILVGAIIGLTGHVQLKKAGKKMNSDAITMSASKSGLGLAINF